MIYYYTCNQTVGDLMRIDPHVPIHTDYVCVDISPSVIVQFYTIDLFYIYSMVSDPHISLNALRRRPAISFSELQYRYQLMKMGSETLLYL